jgi:glutathione S-transferase
MLKLHGPATSPFVRKAWLALAEKGLAFENVALDPLAKTPRFLAMNPMGRVPILEEEDGELISDSSVICDYLEHAYPARPLYPAAPRLRAKALWFEEYADTVLVGPCARVFWMHVIIPVRSGNPVDQGQVAAFVNEHFPPVFDYLESVTPDAGAWLGGDVGIADLSLVSPVRLLDLAGAPLDAARWPSFEAFYRRTITRPSGLGIVAAETYATEVFRTTGNAPA